MKMQQVIKIKVSKAANNHHLNFYLNKSNQVLFRKVTLPKSKLK